MFTTDRVIVGPAAPEADHVPVRRLRRYPAAAMFGMLAALLALAVPFLPVEQDTLELRWPTAAGTGPVTAPLVALRPERLTAQVGCAAIRDVDARVPFPATVLSTTPPNAPDGALVGLRVSVDNGTMTVANRGQVLATAPVPPGDCVLDVQSSAAATSVVLGGTSLVTADGDQRPQVVGVYSDLEAGRDDLTGTAVRIVVDNRFDSSPTALKTTVSAVAVLALVASLLLLHRSDERLGRHVPRLRPRRRRREQRVRDAVVIGVLAVWAVIGSQTADDGYILTMVRAGAASGYVGNYYRWFDVPEAPFGWFYELYALWVSIDQSILWLRLPSLAMGIGCWLLVSRALLPRLGRGVRLRRSATWAAAWVFLCFWLPWCNGLRPEPVVVLCALLALCSVERTLATRRLTPLALGLVSGTFAAAATPTGLIAAAPFIAGAQPILRLLRRRAGVMGWAAVAGPLAGATLMVLIAVFGDQTVAAIAEATRVRTEIGPNLPWFEELYRYQLLFAPNQDGSVARRFPVFLLLLGSAVTGVVLLRRACIPGVATGPARRLVGVTLLGFGVLALTPTKWTHHFGAFAALAAATVSVAVVAASATGLRSRRNRMLFLAAVLTATALAFTGPNTWWYASNWGIPWFEEPPGVKGITVSSVALVAAAVLVVLAGVEHLVGPVRPPRVRGRVVRLGAAPVAALCAFVVLFELGSFGLAVRAQGSGYTTATDVLTDPLGSRCGLSGRVLVETSPGVGLLTPATGPAAGPDPLVAVGFSTDGLPPTGPGSARDTDGSGNLDPNVQLSVPGALPRYGSWSPDSSATGELRTAWYTLPPTEERPAAPLVVAVAGQLGEGTSLTLEFAGSGTDEVVERIDMTGVPAVTATADPYGTAADGRGWRDLRVDLTSVPPEADRVRILAEDRALSPEGWIAVTPPRVPRLTPLTTLVGDAPGFLDWPTAFPHPCLRPFDVHDGVAEVPAYRLMADPQQRYNGNEWSSAPAGGPAAWLSHLGRQRVVPTYLSGEWGRDWGQLRLVLPYQPWTEAADTVTGTRVLWGWTRLDPIGPPPEGRPADAR